MSRISIDVTAEEHRQLKALAALQGKSIKDFVLNSTLGNQNNGAANSALAELEALLDQRIEETGKQGVSTRTVGDIFQRARDEASSEQDA